MQKAEIFSAQTGGIFQRPMSAFIFSLSRSESSEVDRPFEIAKRGDVTAIKAMFDEGVDVNSRDSKEITPLYAAAKEGNLEIVRLILDRGATSTRKMATQSGRR